MQSSGVSGSRKQATLRSAAALPQHQHRLQYPEAVTNTPPRPFAGFNHTVLVGLLSIAIVLLGTVEWLEGVHNVSGSYTYWATLPPLVAGIYALTGIVAVVRRPNNTMGSILLIGSLSVLAGGLTSMTSPTLQTLGLLTSSTILAAMVHALHAFPTGRLRGRWSIATVVAAWAVSLVLQIPVYAVSLISPIETESERVMVELAVWIQRGAGFVVMASTAALLITRVIGADRRQRRVLAPLYFYGVLAVLLVFLAARIFENTDPVLRGAIQLIVIAGVPIAFLVALFRGGFAATGRLEDLSSSLSTLTLTHRDIATALARAIGDPTSTIVYWSHTVGTYVDDHGTIATVPARRGLVRVSVDNRVVGAISYDKVLVGERSLVESAAHILALAIDRERLEADLRASQEDLRSSRERIVAATDAERRRIARDLHDGLQTRLVLIALAADEAQRSGKEADLARLKAGITQAIGELRSFVNDVMPAVLTERGLASALRELGSEISLPVELDLRIGDKRLDATIETAAFMVVSESFSNVLKHSAAATVRVSAVQEGEWLRVRVVDDGVGGAILSTTSGLGGLRDRVRALGGTLSAADVPEGGTVVDVTLPFRPIVHEDAH